MTQLDSQEVIDLVYFDESGFSLAPEVPYGWQEQGKARTLPSSHSKRLNVAGFLNKKSELTSYVFEHSIDSRGVIACFDDFVRSMS